MGRTSNVRQSIQQEFGYNPYIIGDDFFGSSPVEQHGAQFDAITDFDAWHGLQREWQRNRVNALAGIYSNAQKAANSVGVGLYPRPRRATTTAVPPITRRAALSFGTRPISPGIAWQAVLEDAVLPIPIHRSTTY